MTSGIFPILVTIASVIVWILAVANTGLQMAIAFERKDTQVGWRWAVITVGLFALPLIILAMVT